MLWKAADQQIADAGSVPTPHIARGPAAPPAFMDISNCNATLLGKLATVIHVAVNLQDCLAHHAVFVLMKPCASFLSPNMMKMKLYMIMRMKVIVWRHNGAREKGD